MINLDAIEKECYEYRHTVTFPENPLRLQGKWVEHCEELIARIRELEGTVEDLQLKFSHEWGESQLRINELESIERGQDEQLKGYKEAVEELVLLKIELSKHCSKDIDCDICWDSAEKSGLQATCAQQNSQILILETAWKLFDAARQEQGLGVGGYGSTVWIEAAKEELGNGEA